MKNKKLNFLQGGQAHLQRLLRSQGGQASRLLLILGIVVFVAVIIVYVVMRATTAPLKPVVTEDDPTVPKIVYETILGDIKFTFQEAIDAGKILYGSKSNHPDWQKDLVTKEKFIIVTIGAQNKGKENIPDRVWDIGDIIDSEGRKYVSLGQTASAWLPSPNLCGDLLKPEFAATPCTKIYEVARISTGLKIIISSSKKDSSGKYSSNAEDQALIDLIVTQ